MGSRFAAYRLALLEVAVRQAQVARAAAAVAPAAEAPVDPQATCRAAVASFANRIGGRYSFVGRPYGSDWTSTAAHVHAWDFPQSDGKEIVIALAIWLAEVSANPDIPLGGSVREEALSATHPAFAGRVRDVAGLQNRGDMMNNLIAFLDGVSSTALLTQT